MTHASRAAFILAVLIAALAVLAGRAFYLQWHHADFLSAEADKRQLRVFEMPAPRGQILDRNNKLLALSTPIISIWLDPKKLNIHPKKRYVLTELAAALNMAPGDLVQLVNQHAERRYVYVRRGLLPEVGETIAELNLPYVYIKPEYRRYYPQAHTTAHLVGYNNIDDVGQDGVEAIYNPWLTGEIGRFRVVKDLRGRVVSSVATQQDLKPGTSLHLTLDSDIQYFAHKALHDSLVKHQAVGGSVVVIDLATGDLLAVANQPSFNPNDRSQITGEAIRNRAISSLFEPGSTIKPLVIAKLLDQGQAEVDEIISTHPGHLRIHGHLISDAINYRDLNLAEVIQKSSNVAMAKLVTRMSQETLWSYMVDLGFGKDTGLFLPGEQQGRLRHYANWSGMDRVSNSIGYGFNATLIQLAQAYQVLGQEGKMRPLRLVVDQQVGEPRQVISAQAARQVLEMMEGVTQPGGTGVEARIDGYRVAGKTGTVRKTANGAYLLDQYQAMFVGLAPISQPKLLVAVMIDEPSRGVYGGGRVAAPVFKDVMTHALRIRNVDPDQVALP